ERRRAPPPSGEPWRNSPAPRISAPALRIDHALRQEQRKKHDAQVEHDVLGVEQPLLEILQMIDERQLVEQVAERRPSPAQMQLLPQTERHSVHETGEGQRR